MGLLHSEWISMAYIFMREKPMDKEQEHFAHTTPSKTNIDTITEYDNDADT